MKTSKQMQALVTQLAHHYGLDLRAKDHYLRLEKEGRSPLIVQVLDVDQITVGQYYKRQKEFYVPLLEVLLFTGWAEWVPLEAVALVRQVYAFPTAEGLDWHAGRGYIAELVEGWAEELVADDWLAPETQATIVAEETDHETG